MIDDNLSICQSMRFIFSEPDFRVSSAEDGDAALADLADNPSGYDVIIVDYKMPKVTGVEVVQEIRLRGLSSKIIILSAHLSPEVRRGFEDLEVSAVMAKPFDIQDFRAEVNKLAA